MAADTSRVALVTGSSRGLGRHAAERLLERGFLVVGCSRGAADWSAEDYVHREADVTDERQVVELLAAVRDRYGRLDVAVANAGIASMNHALLTPAATLDRVLAVNVRGTFLVARESAKLMRASGSGRIVCLSSVAVPLRLAGESVYAASKAAVESLTRTLAAELAPFGITVNAVGPAPVGTDLLRSVPREKVDALVARLPLGRLGTAEDVFNVIEFFIRPESAAVTGQVVYLGGAG